VATVDARLIAVDAATGKAVSGFGDNGEVNLRNGLRIAPVDFSEYEETSPPAVIGNTVGYAERTRSRYRYLEERQREANRRALSDNLFANSVVAIWRRKPSPCHGEPGMRAEARLISRVDFDRERAADRRNPANDREFAEQRAERSAYTDVVKWTTPPGSFKPGGAANSPAARATPITFRGRTAANTW
jgi:hypothetical protein